MKRTILLLAVVIITAVALSNLKSTEDFSDANEIKTTINYSPKDGWNVSALIGTTFIDDCGPTHSTGVCGMIGLAAGTYTIKATKNGCTGTLTNVYHPGYGTTTISLGPTNPDLVCE